MIFVVIVCSWCTGHPIASGECDLNKNVVTRAGRMNSMPHACWKTVGIDGWDWIFQNDRRVDRNSDRDRSTSFGSNFLKLL
jgi:hypothetical protein